MEKLESIIFGLKAEVERLQGERDEWFNQSIDLQEQINTLRLEKNNQKAEIERLTEENAELQKQVDELKEQRNKNYLKGEIIMKDEKTLLNEIKEQCGDCEAWSGTDCTRNPYTQGCLKDEKQVVECHGMLEGCDMVKQAVKDTAVEALEQFICECLDEHIVGVNDKEYMQMLELKDDILRECYGVEVE